MDVGISSGCRHNSAWLYFPHIELVYLLFAYQGATAAEARMLYSGCPTLVALGAIALVRLDVKKKIWTKFQYLDLTFEIGAAGKAAFGTGDEYRCRVVS